MLDSEKTTDIVDTTDCLEAVGAFKAMKNFLFTISLICLVLLQICFILDRLGYIDKTKCLCQSTTVPCAGSGCAKASEQIIPNDEPQGPPLPAFDKASDPTQTAVVDKITADAEAATENATEQAQDVQQPPETSESDDKKISEMLMPRARHIAALIKTCNFILIITISLYSLVLLMILKISLTGRLGGINHISRAFFISLFALVLLLPWQLCFPSVIAGVIYTPKELLCSCNASAVPSVVGTIFCYLRFTGLWLIEILLLLFAQLRSMRWSKATLRRLGILQ
jgi:hypothetical protein